MRTTTTAIVATLFLSSAQAFSLAGSINSSPSFGMAAREQSTTALFNSALDGLNREMLNNKDDDDDVPMTKAEMREAAKEMKAEMKRLKEEAAAAAKEE
jgi:hypothetical protein